MKKQYLSYSELNPRIHDIGLQGSDSWRINTRKIYDHELLFCVRGEAYAKLNGDTIHLRKGEALLIPPNTAHLFWQDRGKKNHILYLHFDYVADEFSDAIQKYYVKSDHYLDLFATELHETELIRKEVIFEDGRRIPRHQAVQNPSRLAFLLQEIMSNFYDERQAILLKRLMLEVIEELLKMSPTSSKHRDQYSLDARRVRLMQDVIRTRYFEPLKVEDIVEPTGLNRDYASRLFKQETRQTIMTYLNLHRLRQAQLILIDQDLSIAEVADMVGFKTHSYFSTVCKKYFGMTPTELRIHSLESLGYSSEDRLLED